MKYNVTLYVNGQIKDTGNDLDKKAKNELLRRWNNIFSDMGEHVFMEVKQVK